MLKLTVLVDNRVYDKKMRAEHGFSLLIEQDRHKILFDLGASDLFLHNLLKANIKVRDITKVIISHRHNDHSGGLPYFIAINQTAAICAHPSLFYPVYKKVGDKYINIGVPYGLDIESQIESQRFLSADKPLWIDENMIISGEISRSPHNLSMEGTYYDKKDGCYQKIHMIDDISLFIKTPKGLIIITGCAHAGVNNIIENAVELTKENNIYLLIGGLHLDKLSDKMIYSVAEKMSKFHIKNIALSHCSGINAYCIFKEKLDSNVTYTGTGYIVEI